QETLEIDYYKNLLEKKQQQQLQPQQQVSQEKLDVPNSIQNKNRTHSNISNISSATTTIDQRNDRFALCRSHINQLGLILFENRNNIELLNTSKSNSNQLLREMKHLDTLHCRETHKIGKTKIIVLSIKKNK
ncbi:unnamed protein product, partial [Didymodactylos carnosus]